MTRQGIILIALMCALSLAAGSSEAHDKADCVMVKPPTTPDELFANLLCLAKNSPKIDDNFYIDDQKLWELTAGQSFFRTYPLKPGSKSTLVTHFPDSINHFKLRGDTRLNPYLEMSISFLKVAEPFELHMRVGGAVGTGLRFADIETIFGKNWKAPDDNVIVEPWGFNSPAPEPVDTHGNQKIRYNIAVSRTEHAIITVTFNYQGICSDIIIVVEKVGARPLPRVQLPPPAVIPPPPYQSK